MICKLCGGTVVFCGSKEYDEALPELSHGIHECHLLVCLDCKTSFDLGDAVGLDESESFDEM